MAPWALSTPTPSSSSSVHHSLTTRRRITSHNSPPAAAVTLRCGFGQRSARRPPPGDTAGAPRSRRSPPPLPRSRFSPPSPPRASPPARQRRDLLPPSKQPQRRRQDGEEGARKRHWKEGEFPGLPEGSLVAPRRTPVKNIKKKSDDREAAKAWAPTVTETLTDKTQKKQWQEALEVFDVLKEQPFYQPKEGTYMKLIVLLGKSGQAERAHQLFDSMIEEGIEPTSELYTALLSSYCRSNLIDGAFSVLNKMKTLPRCQPDVYTYSTLIKACVDETRFELVDLLFQEMSDRSITPNTVTQNIILGGYGKAGKYDKMEKVLSMMLESDLCKPDVWTMNTIVSLFGNKGQIDLMEKWYEKFRSLGIEPETRTFNILIGSYGKRRMYDKMTAVMEYMRKLEFPWTTSTYNNVIEAFADIGDAKHMEYTFDQMREERMKADTKTFCCLIKGYSNAGLFHKVVSSVKLAEKLEVQTNTSFYNAVISACAKAGDLLEMERVFNHMKEKHFSPDSGTYAVMVEAYEKEGMRDKIYNLEQEVEQLTGDLAVVNS